MTPEKQQAIQNKQYNVDNTPLAPVPLGPDFVNPWGPVTQVFSSTTAVSTETGPLKDLHKNAYDKTSIAYPKDIDSLDKGHAIQFNIREIKPFTITASQLEDKLKQIKTNLETSYNKSGGNIAQKSLSALEKTSDELLKMKNESVSDKSTVIRLYMPDTLNFSQQAQYDKLSLADAINSTPLIGKISTAITSMVNSGLGKMVSGKLGYTFNPQQQMLFEGIDFREFDLQFTFTPTSADEAANVREIIRILRWSSAPTKMTGLAGFFWKPPAVFDIGFFFNGRPNPNIPPVLRCVLQSVNVDYAPNGWATLSKGEPVQTTLSLSFKEIELMDRDQIEQSEKDLNAKLSR